MKEDIYKKFLDKVSGKLTIIFGEPMIGKTTFVKQLITYKPTLWIKIDNNYNKTDIETMDNILEVIEIKNPYSIFKVLEYYMKKDLKNVLIVIDSLTTLAGNFLKGRIGSPRANKELADFYDTVLSELSKLKEKGATILIITHEALKRWDQVAPRINLIALRHVDIVFRMYIDNEGKRHIKIWRERQQINNPEVILDF